MTGIACVITFSCYILRGHHECRLYYVPSCFVTVILDPLHCLQIFLSEFLMFIIVVAINCNNGNSFRCGPDRCIPKVFKCDGIVDCFNGEDEVGCQFPSSCQEWWDAGYHENGMYAMSKCFM